VAQAKDNVAAVTVQKVLKTAFGVVAIEARKNPALAELAETVGQLEPRVNADRVTLEADVQKTASLIYVPIQQAREAALRSQCTNNLKQIALAMHNYHSANNAFPPAFNTSTDGKPLLSWRVHLLPLLGHKGLYEQFHLDESWDSPHNRALVSRMPTLYACPSHAGVLLPDGKTTYLTPRGPDTIFPGKEPVAVKDITDGTSNTILVVDASDARAVVWTKPDDWEAGVEPNGQGLFGHHPGGTSFAFGDGSVHFLKETVTSRVLKSLLTRNGGEVISANDY
jgi:hypothetical protein